MIGTPNFFSFVSELRDPKDFTFSVIVSQTFITTAYLVSTILEYPVTTDIRSSLVPCTTMSVNTSLLLL